MLAKRLCLPDPLVAVTDDVIMAHVARGSRVVDLGCGNGRLLERLQTDHACDVLGVELDLEEFTAALGRGLSVIRADLDDGLRDVPSGAFDVAVLSQTLQQIRRPLAVLDEMLRVAKRALVVVPNFGYWEVRLQVVLQGRAPVTDSLPYQWFESPNVHFLTMLDFRDLSKRGNFKIVKELPIIGERAVNRAWFANLRAHSALYVLERPE
jgi:methionine biosynthesis protein MetW